MCKKITGILLAVLLLTGMNSILPMSVSAMGTSLSWKDTFNGDFTVETGQTKPYGWINFSESWLMKPDMTGYNPPADLSGINYLSVSTKYSYASTNIMSVSPNTVYYLTGMYRGNVPGYKVESGTGASIASQDNLGATTEWKFFSKSFNTGSNSEMRILLRNLNAADATGEGVIPSDFANVALLEGDPAASSVLYFFDRSTNKPTRLTSQGIYAVTAKFDAWEYSYNGGGNFVSAGANLGTLVTGHAYRITYYYRTDNAATAPGINFYIRGTGGKEIRDSLPSKSSVWKKGEISFVCPVSYGGIDVYSTGTAGVTTGTTQVCGITVTELTKGEIKILDANNRQIQRGRVQSGSNVTVKYTYVPSSMPCTTPADPLTAIAALYKVEGDKKVLLSVVPSAASVMLQTAKAIDEQLSTFSLPLAVPALETGATYNIGVMTWNTLADMEPKVEAYTFVAKE